MSIQLLLAQQKKQRIILQTQEELFSSDIRINPSNNTISEWKYIEFVDLFRNLGRWNYDLTRLNNWGTGGEENRMSVVNSLITNNIDRTKFEASGTATKALLTAEEISQIEAMGYTLA